jgi:hypothetical protein
MHRGKISPNRIDSKLKSEVIEILRKEESIGFGPIPTTTEVLNTEIIFSSKTAEMPF